MFCHCSFCLMQVKHPSVPQVPVQGWDQHHLTDSCGDLCRPVPGYEGRLPEGRLLWQAVIWTSRTYILDIYNIQYNYLENIILLESMTRNNDIVKFCVFIYIMYLHTNIKGTDIQTQYTMLFLSFPIIS